MAATPFKQLTSSIRGGTRQGWHITGMGVGQLFGWQIVVINAWAPNPSRPSASINIQPPLTVTETFTLPPSQSHTIWIDCPEAADMTVDYELWGVVFTQG